ncbi:MAG: hypothetical protein RLZZ385_1077 [Pseudomonadota bacterium]|jgi:hypothetical protein
MEKDKRIYRPLLQGLLLFTLLGMGLATETLARLGMQDNYVLVVSVAFVLALLLLRKGPVTVGLVLLGVAAVNLPASYLTSWGVDRDFLLALVCAVILAPTVYQLVGR